MDKRRLFLGSCISLISTSVAFAVVGAVMSALKAEFILSNVQVGFIGGAAIWGFTLSIFALGPLVDALGMRNLMFFACACHLVGPLVMIFASGDAAYSMLFTGALIVALGNGTVEAVCNPLIATVFADEKAKKLNQFHVWFPGGIVIGSVLCWAIDQGGIGNWQLKLALILVPTVVYGFLFIGQRFPATERVQSGISFDGMVRGAFGSPLFLVLLVCMGITASLELGPGRWIPAVLEAGGIAGILVLAYINGLMALLRSQAGVVIHRLTPTGILVFSAVLAGLGLYWFSFAESTVSAFASATVFAVGVCYFWPTMLGVVTERVPRSGSLGLALVGGMGMLTVGVVTAPLMGRIADEYLHENLPVAATRAVLEQVVDTYPAGAANEPATIRAEILAAVEAARAVLSAEVLPPGDTAEALRGAAANAPSGEVGAAIQTEIGAVLAPADNYGGRMSFRFVAPLALVIVVVFGALYVRDRASGGYRAERLDRVDPG